MEVVARYHTRAGMAATNLISQLLRSKQTFLGKISTLTFGQQRTPTMNMRLAIPTRYEATERTERYR